MEELRQAWDQLVDAYEQGCADSDCLSLVRAWIEAWDNAFWANDFSAFPHIYSEDVEVENHTIVPFINGWRGIEGFRRVREDASDVASRFSFDIRSFRRAPKGRFVGTGRIRARGRYSSIVVQAPLSVVWTTRDRKVSRVEAYTSARKALHHAGIDATA